MLHMVFADRRHGGRRLAGLLSHLAAERPVVVALPRGGVPVAVEVAKALDAPLEVMVVRKLGAPGEPELGVGAIAEDGTAVVDGDMTRRLGISDEEVGRVVEREQHELRRRVQRFRQGRAPLDLAGRTVIVVDDGLATGLTDLAAVRAVRRAGAARVIVAVPVGSREGVARLRPVVDEIRCHTIPHELQGVGRWYEDFAQVSDEEVLALLEEATAHTTGGPRHGDNG